MGLAPARIEFSFVRANHNLNAIAANLNRYIDCPRGRCRDAAVRAAEKPLASLDASARNSIRPRSDVHPVPRTDPRKAALPPPRDLSALNSTERPRWR